MKCLPTVLYESIYQERKEKKLIYNDEENKVGAVVCCY